MTAGETTAGETAAFDVSPHIDAVTTAVREASVRSLSWYRRLDAVDNKLADGGGFDPVTEADRAVERALRDELSAMFPDHAILGEEYGLTGHGPLRWTIDPIDGTRAFITGQPMWGTLLGFQVADDPVAGWLHVPALDETFVGHRGGPCRMATRGEDGRVWADVSVSGTTSLDDATVLCTDPAMFAPGVEADSFAAVVERAKLVRYAGDCVNYALVAMGLADQVIENGLAAYDIVPLIPIIEAAGGLVTDLDGNRPMEGGFVVASATEALHGETLEVLAPVRR
jgi:myo-inositol-1(or 4)-monophosphatase